MIKMEMIEEAEAAEAMEALAEVAVVAAAMEIEVIEIEETNQIEEEATIEETTMTKMAEEAMVETRAAGAVAAKHGTKVQASTLTIRNPKENHTTMILHKVVALPTQVVINFQLLQHPTHTLKIIELKSTMTLNQKINLNNLLDLHRLLTLLFI